MNPQVNHTVLSEKIDLAEHVRVTINQNFTEYDGEGGPKVRFLRVEVNDLKPALRSIIADIADTSWISGLVDEIVTSSFLARAQPTIDKLSIELNNAIASGATESAGEYIVSMVARCTIESIYDYRALPLAEVIKEQKSGNPGFDYHHENTSLVLRFGEAKYKTGRNAYGSAFSQIVDHIKLQKDVKEIVDLSHFMSEGAKANFCNGKKGYSAAFSTSGKSFDSNQLIANIKDNAHFGQLLEHEALVVVAVDVND